MVADPLVARHFTAQDARPDDVRDVALGALSSFLRGLVLLDGTVSRALESETLQPVEVEPVEQEECEPPEATVHHLQLAAGERCLRRRIVMRLANATPSVWAESFVVPQRLPGEFLQALAGNSHGIGGALRLLRLENTRELLWFGRSTPPPWRCPTETPAATVRRSYLIVTRGRPGLQITEDFAVRENGGALVFMGADEQNDVSDLGRALKLTPSGGPSVADRYDAWAQQGSPAGGRRLREDLGSDPRLGPTATGTAGEKVEPDG